MKTDRFFGKASRKKKNDDEQVVAYCLPAIFKSIVIKKISSVFVFFTMVKEELQCIMMVCDP